jgi:hypothetical protein
MTDQKKHGLDGTAQNAGNAENAKNGTLVPLKLPLAHLAHFPQCHLGRI